MIPVESIYAIALVPRFALRAVLVVRRTLVIGVWCMIWRPRVKGKK
jgi:hypothetical protein